jgi:hypothetical protein
MAQSIVTIGGARLTGFVTVGGAIGGGGGGGPIAHAATTGQTPDDHHARDHASTHDNGGVDALTVEDLSTASTTLTHVLSPDGSGGLLMRPEASGGGDPAATLSFGGDFNNFDIGDHALVNGLARGLTQPALDDRTQAASPTSGTSLSFGWSTESGDATSVVKIVQNGLVVDTITLTGPSGAVTGRSVSTSVGDLYAIEFDSGSVLNGANFELVVVP